VPRFGRLAAFAGVATLSFVGLLLSLGVQLVISRHFGTSAVLDAYLFAYTITMFATFFVTPLREAVGPQFFAALADGPGVVERLMQSVLGWLLLALCISTALMIALSFGLSRGWLPLDLALQSNMAVALTWLLPVVILTGLAEVLNGLFACYDRPVWQQAVRLVIPAVTLVVVPAGVEALGVRALALAVVLGMGGMVLLQWFFLIRMGLKPKIGLPRKFDAKLVSVAGALATTYFMAQLYALVERTALSTAETGLLSSYNYGAVLTNAVVTTLAVSLVNVAYPRLLSATGSDDAATVTRVLGIASRWLVFAGSGLSAVVWVLAPEVIEILFARGKFDAASVAMTVGTLRATIFASVPIGIYLLAGRALLARQSSKGLTVAGVAIAVSGIAVILIARGLDNRALLIHHWLIGNAVGAVIAVIWLRSALGESYRDWRRRAVLLLLPLAVAAITCALGLYARELIEPMPPFLLLLSGAPLVLAMYLGGCWVTGALPPLHELAWRIH
jgi:putative peptidoglycan lipid II flippase